MKFLKRLLLLVSVIFVAVMAVIFFLQRKLLFFPTHEPQAESSVAAGFKPWTDHGQVIGYAREVIEPRRIWFHTHGNGGQAANRDFILHCLSPKDSIFVLEYPGYGNRPGSPSKESFNHAAEEAYESLVQRFGVEKILVLGESLGSGPASHLAKTKIQPRHIVLVVPFDVLTSVARDRFWFVPTKFIMRDQWDNVESLRGYSGKVDIFGASNDTVIPVFHARRLAASHEGAIYHEFEGGHGWTQGGLVDLSKID